MSFESAAKFDATAKRAIKASDGDTGNKYRAMLRDRFLCRVFSDPEERFILKGGSGLLARIPDSRATKDIDFGTREPISADEAFARIDTLAHIDLDDFIRFELTSREETLDKNGYSRLLKLRYATYVGDEEKDPVLIDLSLDCEITLPPERINPANRVPIDGIATCDYLVCSLPDQLADKFCAIMERQPGGWPSSRMKDLVDVIAYVTTHDFKFSELRYAIECECQRRSMDIPNEFAAPEEWRERFKLFAQKNNCPDIYTSFNSAVSLASNFFNPVLLSDESPISWWRYALLGWVTD